MATGSTKRNRKRARDDWSAKSLRKRREAEESRQGRAPAPAPDIPERAWLYASAAILLLALALRVYALEMKPLHHDEGVNGFFLTNLLRQGRYFYNPENYHGPTLYYLTLPFVKLAGLHTFLVRLITSLFGVGVVWLLLCLRKRVGTVAVLAAALLVAVSPACVFYSRYFIHEIPFVFFTLGLVVAALRFRETGAVSDLLMASAAAALMFATKETAFISVGTLGLAWLTADVWGRVRGGGSRRGKNVWAPPAPEGGFAKLGREGKTVAAIAGAAALFAFIWVAFYTSFFTHSKGAFWDSFDAFVRWKKTGLSAFHGKPWYTYISWLWQEDAAILTLGYLGALVALFERRLNRFAVFFAAWGFGLLAAYSIISYKTPWLVLNFLVPMALAAGYCVQTFGTWVSRVSGGSWRGAAALVLAAASFSFNHTLIINFRDYDDDRHPYVYSQTRREFHDLVREIERVGERAGTKEPAFATASPEYWPMPWYTRGNQNAGYSGVLENYYDPRRTLAVVGREDQLPQLQRVLGATYTRVGTIYPLRPGVNLILFARNDLAPK